MKTKHHIWFMALTLFTLCTSCKDDLNLSPESSNSAEDFFKTQQDVEQALIGVYDALQSGGQYGLNFIYLMEVRSDNSFSRSITNSGGEFGDIELFREQPANSRLNATWSSCYQGIQRANTVLNRVNTVSIAETDMQRIIGEAKFMRALTYFNMVRIWGGVPLMTAETDDPFAYADMPRATEDAVYELIEADLQEAISLLPQQQETGRATKGAAQTLLGKVYLTRHRYTETVTMLQNVLGTYSLLNNYADVFATANENNAESIFEIQYQSGLNGEGSAFANYMAINQSQVSNGAVYGDNQPTPALANLYATGDTRKTVNIGNLNGSLFCNKYMETLSLNADGNKNFIVLRYADVLLMYAEALNEISYSANSDAFTYLNMVRERALPGAGYTTGQLPDQESFRQAVALERRLELAFENHRWFDLVRTGKAVETINSSTLKNGATGNIQPYRLYYPIPQTQIDASAGAIIQNPGY